MNAAVATRRPAVDEAESVKESIARAREAVSRILFAARTLGEGHLVPCEQRDILNPALAINDSLCLVESLLDLDRTEWPTYGANPEESEASGES